MLSYDLLCRHPAIFPDLTGLARLEFDALALRFQAAERARRDHSSSTRAHRPRVHAPGAGRPFAHDHRNRLFMALLWLRIYPTYAVLGFFFDLHKRNAQLNVRAVLEVLDSLDDFPFDRPGKDQRKFRSAAEVMTAFPQVAIIIDSKEQRINRPQGYETQKPYYSGKKKAHTVKTQIAVDPCGRIVALGGSVPGSTHDLTLLRGSGVLEKLEPGEAGMMDKGYVGVEKYYPGVPVIVPHKAARGRPLTKEQEAANGKIARARIVVEHTLAQVNRFTVLRQVLRGKQRERHSGVIRVVGKLVNQRLRVKPLKTYAAAA
jgi:DDE superfamily endonuclease